MKNIAPNAHSFFYVPMLYRYFNLWHWKCIAIQLISLFASLCAAEVPSCHSVYLRQEGYLAHANRTEGIV